MRELMTLGKGGKAKKFLVEENINGFLFRTGQKKEKTTFAMASENIRLLLERSRNKSWFPLGNNITDIKSGGFGERLRLITRKSPKFASHVAAFLVDMGLLEYRDTDGRIELRIK